MGASHVISGEETIAAVRMRQAQTLLAFSCGKDAIAAWLAIRPHFDRVVPYYLYLVPGLEFVEEALDYYERFFGCRILRFPHPSLYRMLNNFVFQPPERCLVIEQASLPKFDYSDIREVIVDSEGMAEATLVADGVRAADSPMRRLAMVTHGPISERQHKYHPIWDWKKADLVACFRKHGVKLPVDYKLFGRTFDGIDLRFLLPLKKHRPADYRRILDYFPMADLEVRRYEMAGGSRV
ncbi:MAG: hypothetical protein KER_03073 [Kerstersia gyiorum]|uniref:phosphoadenosine phosphosulfate reductase n=1 Tax=Kerstersia gyiorum TaxID=206506 RepID=UPI0030D041AC